MEMQQQGTWHILFQLSSSISAWLAHIPGKQQEHLFLKILQLPEMLKTTTGVNFSPCERLEMVGVPDGEPKDSGSGKSYVR